MANTDDLAHVVTFKFRLCDKHAAELNRQARAVNFVWNYCNEVQQKAAGSGRRWLNAVDLQRLTAGAYAYVDLHAHTIQKICQHYDRSRSEKRRPWLKFRGRKSLGWVPFNQGTVRVTAAGTIKFRKRIYHTMHWRTLPADAIVRGGSFNQDARGRWYVNLPIEMRTVAVAERQAIGVDLGLRHLAVASSGEAIPAPQHYRRYEQRLASAQRAGKRNLTRALRVKAANCRKDHLHKISTRLALTHSTIIVGNVSSSKLARTKMAKSVLDAGWSMFRKMLSYKAIRHGGTYLEIDECMTSQTCSSCGAVPPERPRGIAGLGIREWTCGGCGETHDRDVNAARNILRIGLDTLAEGAAP